MLLTSQELFTKCMTSAAMHTHFPPDSRDHETQFGRIMSHEAHVGLMSHETQFKGLMSHETHFGIMSHETHFGTHGS
jgi:hypothetical protein